MLLLQAKENNPTHKPSTKSEIILCGTMRPSATFLEEYLRGSSSLAKLEYLM